MRDLSIAIVSWNTCELLDQCLASVYEYDHDYEVIVVDNASSDGSAAMVREKYPDVHLIESKVNLGFATGCNLAAKYSTARYLLLLNSDTIVLNDALDRLVRFMDAHPDAGIAGCRLLNADGSLQRSCSSFPSVTTELFDALYLSKLFTKNRFFARYSMSYWNFDETREVDFAGGSCLIVRREAIEEVGLLDEGYFMYTEEADWCYRMWQKEWKVYFYPKAEIIHLGGQSARKYGSDITIYLYGSRNRFIQKHFGRVKALLHRGVVVGGAFLRMLIFSVKRSDTEAVSFQRKLIRAAMSRKFAPGGER